jgi:hypothetical protein
MKPGTHPRRRVYQGMTNPLQAKDDQWRDRRENGSVPVFDPGLSPLGTDDEAGGARAPVDAAATQSDRTPLPSSPEGVGGVRATPAFWYAAAAAIVLVLAVVGWMSFA